MRETKRKYALAHIVRRIMERILFNLKAEERSLSRYIRIVLVSYDNYWCENKKLCVAQNYLIRYKFFNNKYQVVS